MTTQDAHYEAEVGERGTRTLLERHTAGLNVYLNYLPTMGMLVLHCTTPAEPVGYSVTVEPHEARDAFDHPTIYLGKAQVRALLGERP